MEGIDNPAMISIKASTITISNSVKARRMG